MELLQEECLALKARLDVVQQDKAADLATYKQISEQIRQIFHEVCRCVTATNENAKCIRKLLKMSFPFRSKPLPPIGTRSVITV